MNKKQIKVANFWGIAADTLMCIEEMGELIQALIKLMRIKYRRILIPTSKTLENTIDNVAEEIADVRICLDELEYLLGIEDRVQEWSVSKKKREYKRFKKARKERSEYFYDD